jgi:hypothetical protein
MSDTHASSERGRAQPKSGGGQWTVAEVEAAIAALGEPGRLDAAQQIVTAAAPTLNQTLARALEAGGWFDTAHNAAVHDAVAETDSDQRLRAVRTLLAEEVRLSMLVGVAVGLELGIELDYPGASTTAQEEE